MLLHGSKVSHVLGKQQGVLCGISNIPSCALLEVSDGGITKKGISIQLHAWGLSWGCSSVVTHSFSLFG